MTHGAPATDKRLRTTLVWPYDDGPAFILSVTWDGPDFGTGAVRIGHVAVVAATPVPLGLVAACAAVNLALIVDGGLDQIADLNPCPGADGLPSGSAALRLVQALKDYEHEAKPAAAYALDCLTSASHCERPPSGLRSREDDDDGPSVMIRCGECGGMGYSPTRDIRSGEVEGWPPPVMPYGPWLACEVCGASGMLEMVPIVTAPPAEAAE